MQLSSYLCAQEMSQIVTKWMPLINKLQATELRIISKLQILLAMYGFESRPAHQNMLFIINNL